LKLHDADPNIGRFFPIGCNVQQMPSENLFVQFIGHGYAWTNVTGRMGFEASAAVEYKQDFLMDGSTMYVYFRQAHTETSRFEVKMVERTQAGAIGGVASLLGTNLQGITQQLGDRILQHQLARGFTVVRQSDGEVSFALGVLEKGAQPDAPFAKGDSDWPLLANERTELHHEQRDFAGPFLLEDEDDALWLTAHLEGAPGVDVLVVPKAVGDTWIKDYETNPQAGPPPSPPLAQIPLQATGAMGPPKPFRSPLRLPLGSYYLVFDNTASAGPTVPQPATLDDRAALVSYGVQLGDAP
ncbi:MAG: hypothetical protein KC731_34790, partial [Myxococcales bacterium]|nr:hypothetical protein [Myxococcales bacterium]